jgi:hypothetical protein
MKRVVLCVEGKLTDDGRILEPGSVTWVDRIPIMRGNRIFGDLDVTIGYVTNICREGSLIVGNAHLDEDTGAYPIYVGADMDHVECFVGSQGDVRFTKALLRGVHVVDAPSWPEAMIS